VSAASSIVQGVFHFRQLIVSTFSLAVVNIISTWGTSRLSSPGGLNVIVWAVYRYEKNFWRIHKKQLTNPVTFVSRDIDCYYSNKAWRYNSEKSV